MTSQTTSIYTPFSDGRPVRDIVEHTPALVNETWCRNLLRHTLDSLEQQYASGAPHRAVTPDTLVMLANGEALLLPSVDESAKGGSDPSLAGDLHALALVVHYAITSELPPDGPLGPRLYDDYSEQLTKGLDCCLGPNRRLRPHTVAEMRSLLGIETGAAATPVENAAPLAVMPAAEPPATVDHQATAAVEPEAAAAYAAAPSPLADAQPEPAAEPEAASAVAFVEPPSPLDSQPAPVAEPEAASAVAFAEAPPAPDAQPVPVAEPEAASAVTFVEPPAVVDAQPVVEPALPPNPQPALQADSRPAVPSDLQPELQSERQADPQPEPHPVPTATPAVHDKPIASTIVAESMLRKPASQDDATPRRMPERVPPATFAKETGPAPAAPLKPSVTPEARPAVATAARTERPAQGGLQQSWNSTERSSRAQRWGMLAGAAVVVLAAGSALVSYLQQEETQALVPLSLPPAERAANGLDGGDTVVAPPVAAAPAPADQPAAQPAEDSVEMGAPPPPAGAAEPVPAAGRNGGAVVNGTTYKLLIKPWGTVYVDGVDRGVSPPVKRLTLAPGQHAIRIVNPSFPEYTMTVDAGSRESIVIEHDFTAKAE